MNNEQTAIKSKPIRFFQPEQLEANWCDDISMADFPLFVIHD